jgi:hypothetical protein
MKHKVTQLFIPWFNSLSRFAYVHDVEVCHKWFGLATKACLSLVLKSGE